MDIFFQIGIMFIIAAACSYVVKLLKQPLIMAYLLTGIIVSPYAFNLLKDSGTIQTLAQIGIVFLLFITGLSLNPTIIKGFGRVSLFTGVGQVLFTSIIGFIILFLLGFSSVESAYIAVALTFSSTIIIMKLLSDKKETETLYGRIAIGFLIVQDIIAMFILMVVSSTSSGVSLYSLIVNVILKISLLLSMLYLMGVYVLPRTTSKIAKSQEFLMIFSIAWCMGLSILFYYLNFSIELGALLAGVTLSVSTYRHEISSRLRPLRDFFLVIFFIFLGSNLVLTNFSYHIASIIILSLFILIGNPLIVIAIMSFFGYSSRTGFMAGLTVAQISEFSLILVALGVKLGHLSPEILSLVTIIGIITIAGSVYMVTYSNKIYPYFSKYLKMFDRKSTKKDDAKSPLKNLTYDIILFGHNRIGFSLLRKIKDLDMSCLVVDFNPEIIKTLENNNINCVYGDAQDAEFLSMLNFDNSKLIISTIPDLDTNKLLLEFAKARNSELVTFITSNNIDEAFVLYKKGADYVILPHLLGGEKVGTLIKESIDDIRKTHLNRLEHICELKKRIEMEHEHPRKA